MSVDNNELSGEIPLELSNLSNLRRLNLVSNQLSGEIPAELGSLSNLRELNLSSNQLIGELPAELGRVSALRELNLSSNQLTGEIPAELGDLTNLQRLALSNNQLTGSIPAELGSLANLEYLLLSGNQFVGCMTGNLRGVAQNDLGHINLPYCDVVLSGLVVSPGSLVPAFDPNRTDYSASVGLSPVTVTVAPTNDHNATFEFLDNNDAVLADADNSLAGFQVEFGGRVPAVKIRVVSQDTQATHTYVVTDLGNRYDTDDSGAIDRIEVVAAIKDFFGERITREEVVEVIKLFFVG